MNEPEYLLALETSSITGGAALLANGELHERIELAEGMRHGRELLPTAEQLLLHAGLEVRDLVGIAVSVGPGSYTGTRIGVMAAKTLAWAVKVPLTAVSSLAALAAGAPNSGELVVPIQHARRDEVYAAVYRLAVEAGQAPIALTADCALTPEEAAALCQGRNCTVLGSAVAEYPELFAGLADNGVKVLADRASPDAAMVGRLGWLQLKSGEQSDPLTLQPVYPRRAGDPGQFG